jgi:Flp pilus assembly protein TadG
MSTPSKSMANKERGQTTAEFVAVLPFMLLLFFLVVEFGWMLKNYIVVTDTASATARCAVTLCDPLGPEDYGYTALADFVGAETPNHYLRNRNVCVVEEDGSVRVTVTADNHHITPILSLLGVVGFPNPMKLTGTSVMRAELPVGDLEPCTG